MNLTYSGLWVHVQEPVTIIMVITSQNGSYWKTFLFIYVVQKMGLGSLQAAILVTDRMGTMSFVCQQLSETLFDW